VNYQDYKRIILGQMRDLLKPQGFRKSASTFVAERNDVLLFVQLQSSTKTTRQTLIVTVNLGIVSLLLHHREGYQRKPNFLDSHWSERIGHFLLEGGDKWWEMNDSEGAVRAGAEITNILKLHGLPALEALAATERLRQLWQSGQRPGLTDFERKKYLALLDKLNASSTG